MIIRNLFTLPSLLLLTSFLDTADSKRNVDVQTGEGVKIANRTIERLVDLRTHSIFPPYIDQDLQNQWWDFGADAYVNTNKHIRLTRNVASQTGWLWSRLPVTTPNYEIVVEFKISGESAHLYGDGLAMWLTKERATPGPIFGHVDKFEGLGIIIDTYANGRHSYVFPRILATMGDGSTPYDLDNDGDATHLAACSVQIRRTNVITKLKLTYIKDEFLDLKVQYKAWDDWTPCFSLNNITLPKNPFLGFTALTGDVADNHDIISVNLASAFLSLPGKERTALRPETFFRKARKAGQTSWFWWFLKWILFVVVAVVMWTVYQAYVMNAGGRMRGGRSIFDRMGKYNPNKRF